MSEARSAALHAGPPLTQRLAETPPWSPLRLAFAIAGTLFTVFLAVEAIFGRLALVFGDATGAWARETQINFRLTLVMILLVAYLPAAYAIGARGARRTVEELRPYLRRAWRRFEAHRQFRTLRPGAAAPRWLDRRRLRVRNPDLDRSLDRRVVPRATFGRAALPARAGAADRLVRGPLPLLDLGGIAAAHADRP